MLKKLLLLTFIFSSFVVAGDVDDVNALIKKHWATQNKKDWKAFVSTLHSGGTMNGDSNGSFWYRTPATVAAVTENQERDDEFNFTPRYIEVDVLDEGNIAIAYYYLVGSYKISGVEKNDYRTRVSQLLVVEDGQWKVKAGHYSPLHSGSGIPN